MATLIERIQGVSDLSDAESQHLRSLCICWHVLADLSFSDLLLYIRIANEDAFEVCAQLRPLTSQTLYEQDMVGARVTESEQPIVERAFREGRMWSQDEPVLMNGASVRLYAVPVRLGDRIIAVVTKEGSPAISRRPGVLEEMYLGAADGISRMICEGTFPFAHIPLGEWPRVGEGLLLLNRRGRIDWASPNALSSLHRLGVSHNVEGTHLDDLGLEGSPTRRALWSQAVVDSELVQGDTAVRLRLVPLIHGGESIGALALARDVSEVRRRERLISVKDATIREIHHRVKNNLQTIASLLRLQGRRVDSSEARSALRESELRIGSIALVHETLSENSSDLAEFGDVARRIAGMVAESLILPERRIEMKVTGSTGPLQADLATPLAVTLAELMQNAVEHAFPEDRSGTIGVEMFRSGDRVGAVVWDDGVGIEGAPSEAARLGLHIVRTLVKELGGAFELTSNGGTRAVVSVPAPTLPSD
ncbi:MAG: sensor histidine kinase [Actinomycetota bacterium]|nr:sensor histidine kinase [Actinomycetota bacterium]